MAALQLTLACWSYDRVRALVDGSVRPEGIDLVHLPLEVEETFFRMLRFREFDLAEMSLSSYVVSLRASPPPFIAIPVFPSRAFRHSGIYISAKSAIAQPQDLKGKRVGVPEYQLTANVWIRGILADHYGVPVDSVEYFAGGEEQPGREEKVKLELPASIRLRPIGPRQTLSRMLAEGELDALQAPRAPSTLQSRPDAVRRLFGDTAAAELDYYRRTRIFPIMHTIAIRREVYERDRWIAQSLCKAFGAAKALAYEGLKRVHALDTMLPWQAAQVEEVRREMGEDWWPYGLAPNRHVLETFLRYHHEQGLSPRRLEPEALFAPETLDSYRV